MREIIGNKKIRLAALLVLCVALPFMGFSNYMVRVMVNCLMYVALALSLNMFSGVCGQISLGHIGFFCAGAYTSALLALNFELPFLICFAAAGVLAGLLGLFIGIPSLKLSGGYLAIITLSASEVVRLIILNWVDLTRGPMGLRNIPPAAIFGFKFSNNKPYYFFMLAFCIILVVLMRNIIASKFGRDLEAIRDDEIASEAMGVNNYRNKVVVFACVAVIAGLVGSVFAHCMRFIDPSSFKIDVSMLILSMVVLGGMGSIKGSIISAVVLTILPELMRGFENYRMLCYGLALVVMMLLRAVKPETYQHWLGAIQKGLSFKGSSKGGEV